MLSAGARLASIPPTGDDAAVLVTGHRFSMGWASVYIERLKQGDIVTFRPRGGSMTGRIESGELCTVEPVSDICSLKVDDIVLCKVHGAEYLHLIKAIQGQRFQIGNNKGYINGWIGPNAIFGRCIRVGT